MVWKVVKSAQPPVRYRPNSDRRPDIVGRARWAGRAHAALRSAQGALVLLRAALHLPRLKESRAVLPSCSVMASLSQVSTSLSSRRASPFICKREVL